MASAAAIGFVNAPLQAKGYFVAHALSVPNSTAALSTNIAMIGHAYAMPSMTAISGFTQLAAIAGAVASADPEFSNTGSPVGLYVIDPDFIVSGRPRSRAPEFPPIQTTTEQVLTFDFSDELETGQTLLGLVNVVVSVSGDFSQTATPTIQSAVASYDTTFTKVSFPVMNGQADTWYFFEVTAPTTN